MRTRRVTRRAAGSAGLAGLAWVAGLLAGGLALTGCAAVTGPSTADGRVEVVAAFYPLQYVAEQVGGPGVDVRNLTKPGAEPHDLELTPRETGAVVDADLVIWTEGFQPAVDDAVDQAQGETLEAGAVAGLEDGDPHFWLDPTRLAKVAGAVADRLAEVHPSGAAGYRARAAGLEARLAALDADLRAGLRGCARTEFVTSHEAFGYLARRYGLTMVAISGLSPEAEPSPARLRDVQDAIREHGVTTVFYETLVSPKVAESLADDLGVRAAVLDPVEGLPEGDRSADYESLMRADLAALRTANGCP